MFILGNFDINLYDYPRGNAASNFVTGILPFDVFPLIFLTTRVTKHSAFLIDNILSNEIRLLNCKSTSNIIDYTLDHYLLLLTLDNNATSVYLPNRG